MNTKPAEAPKDMPEALERIRALEAQLATARVDAVREVVGLMAVEGSAFYYNQPNNYGVITVGFMTGEGDPWQIYRGPEIQAQYKGGLQGSGRWTLNEAFVTQLVARMDSAKGL
ncbi:porin [Novimethylophilus kurashikiensis]|uniref:Porin n=1 Tax=Novimethylophilus kurashikiensis TaxID=1825523 RepID=A0A2R5FDD5_9PROT|nr:hypothetical protein [Novimethylophilus kurashikiensis]GBG14594.1 porin [Novimethylophilus kurashikiensis]